MNRPEFNIQFKKFCEIREHVPAESYIDELYERVKNLTVEEFIFVRSRIFDECRRFPTLADWVHFRGIALEKRVRASQPQWQNQVSCKECNDTGLFKIQFALAGQALASCTCDKSNPEFPALAMISGEFKTLEYK